MGHPKRRNRESQQFLRAWTPRLQQFDSLFLVRRLDGHFINRRGPPVGERGQARRGWFEVSFDIPVAMLHEIRVGKRMESWGILMAEDREDWSGYERVGAGGGGKTNVQRPTSNIQRRTS